MPVLTFLIFWIKVESYLKSPPEKLCFFSQVIHLLGPIFLHHCARLLYLPCEWWIRLHLKDYRMINDNLYPCPVNTESIWDQAITTGGTVTDRSISTAPPMLDTLLSSKQKWFCICPTVLHLPCWAEQGEQQRERYIILLFPIPASFPSPPTAKLVVSVDGHNQFLTGTQMV